MVGSRFGNVVSSLTVGCQVNPASSFHRRDRHSAHAPARMRDFFQSSALPALALAGALVFAPQARANVSITIDGVDADIKANLLVFLSFQRYRESDDLDAETVAR